MLRIPEPELMLDQDQAIAYAEADFSASDSRFVERFTELFGSPGSGEIIDLGCGPGNIALRMAEAFPQCTVTGVDGAAAMLDIARRRATSTKGSASRVRFIDTVLPSAVLPMGSATAVVSNSLLHHLHEPAGLWMTLRQVARRNAAVLVVDLRRPETTTAAQQIVDTYARNEPEILRQDFYNSLLAAFEVDEVKSQLQAAGLSSLRVQAVGDRYLEVSGRMPG
jgi:ubiquinone/menaquinone biosynthesis C-methylase UbiE